MESKKAIGLLTGLAFATATLFSGQAHAARKESYNLIVFDANMNVIGQHAEFCNNYQLEGGSLTGAYELAIVGGCGDQLANCRYEWPDGSAAYYTCDSYSLNIGVLAQFSPQTNFNIENACNIAGGACSSTEPVLMVGRGFDIVQIYPAP